jgi:hypothetical protein
MDARRFAARGQQTDRKVLRRWPEGKASVHADVTETVRRHLNDMVVDQHGGAYAGIRLRPRQPRLPGDRGAEPHRPERVSGCGRRHLVLSQRIGNYPGRRHADHRRDTGCSLYPSRLAVDAGFVGTAKVHLGHGFPGPPRWAHPHQTALLDRESLLKGVLPGHPRSARHSWAGWHDSAEPNPEEVRDLLTMRRACVAPTPILVERFYIESHDAADTIVAILRAEASP